MRNRQYGRESRVKTLLVGLIAAIILGSIWATLCLWISAAAIVPKCSDGSPEWDTYAYRIGAVLGGIAFVGGGTAIAAVIWSWIGEPD